MDKNDNLDLESYLNALGELRQKIYYVTNPHLPEETPDGETIQAILIDKETVKWDADVAIIRPEVEEEFLKIAKEKGFRAMKPGETAWKTATLKLTEEL